VYLPSLHIVAIGAALLIVILFMPGGLLPFIVERVRLRGGQPAAVKEVRP